MVVLSDLEAYTNTLLNVQAFEDYAPNGVQVEGRPEVHRLVTGVTASRALIEAAIAWDADAILVHHGYFWRGEDPRVVGMKRARLALLLDHGISLLAYHLPLDAHPELGNNAQLARLLGLEPEGKLDELGIGVYGRLGEAMSADDLGGLIESALERAPLLVAGGPDPVRRIGWCTGAAQDLIEAAATAGLDAYISGEVSERTTHVARETGIHYFAAGHHATERYGVQALGEHLAGELSIQHRFIDIDNPV
jgi:dinuclear metal center YbgI/SA1388 family protein